MSEPIDRVVYRAFGSESEFLKDIYDVYKEFYDIPELVHEIEFDNTSMFEYVQKRQFFINILPYTLSKKILLTPTFWDTRFAWRMLGGGLRSSFNNNFISVCYYHVQKYFNNVSLGEIEPVAFLTNKFRHGEDYHEHNGICFIARLRNQTNDDFETAIHDSGAHLVHFGQDSPLPDLPQMYQLDAYKLALEKIQRALQFPHQDHEIDTNEQYKARYEFHGRFVKPIMRFFSRIIGAHSIPEYDQIIEDYVLENSPQSLLDVACGENLHHVELVKNEKIDTFIGNDISWSQIELVDRKLTQDTFRNNKGIVLFTNNDARRLPFGDSSFDVVVCKNVLHHMPDLKSVRGLIDEAKRVGKRTVIVEVMNPDYEGRWGRLRHKYYIDFLKDAGGNFLSSEEFVRLTDGASLHTEIPTIRGNYQVAIYE